MDKELYRAAQEGDWNVIRRFENQLYTQETRRENTVLHVVAEFCDSSFVVEQILGIKPKLLLRLNEQGENSLHIAAREGHFNVVQALKASARRCEERYWSSMLTTRSGNGNSVLHEAANKNRYEIVQFLLEECPSLIYSGNLTSGSPLYVAVEKGYEDVAALILSTSKSQAMPHASTYYMLWRLFRNYMPLARREEDFYEVTNLYIGPSVSTALHAAARRNLPEYAKSILEKCPNLTKWSDTYGWTPLHVAARLNYQDVAKELLLADPLMAYARTRRNYDKDGAMTPLHVAVTHGHGQMIKELLLHCPDCWEMVTQQGKNAIHLAMENEQEEVLQFILTEPWSSKVINGKDERGNTPLHLYVATKKLKGCNMINHFELDKNALNKDGLTPLDLIRDAIDTDKERQLVLLYQVAMRAMTVQEKARTMTVQKKANRFSQRNQLLYCSLYPML